MSLKEKLPIEPLSEKRWQAIERGVLDRLDAPSEKPSRRRSFTPFALGVAGALAVAAIVALAFRVGDFGAAFRGDTSETTAPLASTRFATDEAPAETSLGEARVTLAQASALTAVGSDTEGFLVVLEQGSATFEVPPRHERPPFVVQAGPIRVEVVGTRFTVTRGETVSVSVEHGRVRVLEGAEEWIVEDGDHWPRIEAATEVEAAEVEAVAVVERPQVVEERQVVEEGQVVEHAQRVEHPRTEPSVVASHEESPRQAAPEPPAPTARERFQEATSLERTQPSRALEIYASIVDGGGPWAPNALFARGRLSLEIGQRSDARTSLERYLARYPEGPNAEDARALLEGLR